MTRSLSGGLHGRMIAAIEDGSPRGTRTALAVSTADSGIAAIARPGDTEARKQGQPSRSNLDAHEASFSP